LFGGGNQCSARVAGRYYRTTPLSDLVHVVRARRIPGAIPAEHAFLFLAEYDDIRRRILIPVIKTEIRMRGRLRRLDESPPPKWRHGQSVRVIPGLAGSELNREKAEQKEASHRQAIERSWRRLKTSMASALVFFGKRMVFRAGCDPARETSRGPSIIRTT